jgi:hypothetical protein
MKYGPLRAVVVGVAGMFVLFAACPGRGEVGGVQVDRLEPWSRHLGAFNWQIQSERQSDATVKFHIVLTIDENWPEASLKKHPSATLSRISFDPGHGYRIAKDVRKLPLQVDGRSAVSNFSVTKEELKDSTLSFLFFAYPRNTTSGNFIALNDIVDFPASALARLGDKKAPDRVELAERIRQGASMTTNKEERAAYVKALIPYLNDDNEWVRVAVVWAAVSAGKSSKEILVPALTAALLQSAFVKAHDGSEALIVSGLDRLEPSWRSRPEMKQFSRTAGVANDLEVVEKKGVWMLVNRSDREIWVDYTLRIHTGSGKTTTHALTTAIRGGDEQECGDTEDVEKPVILQQRRAIAGEWDSAHPTWD